MSKTITNDKSSMELSLEAKKIIINWDEKSTNPEINRLKEVLRNKVGEVIADWNDVTAFHPSIWTADDWQERYDDLIAMMQRNGELPKYGIVVIPAGRGLTFEVIGDEVCTRPSLQTWRVGHAGGLVADWAAALSRMLDGNGVSEVVVCATGECSKAMQQSLDLKKKNGFIVDRKSEAEFMAEAAKRANPKANVFIEGGSTNTLENMRNVVNAMPEIQAKFKMLVRDIFVVAVEEQAARAKYIATKLFPDKGVEVFAVKNSEIADKFSAKFAEAATLLATKMLLRKNGSAGLEEESKTNRFDKLFKENRFIQRFVLGIMGGAYVAKEE